MEASLDRGPQPAMHLGSGSAVAKDIRIAPEVLFWCKRDGVDAVLHGDMPGGREGPDPVCKRSDELSERVRGQGPVDPAVPFGEARVEVFCTQHDFESAGAAHEPHQVLSGTTAGELAERRLELGEDR